MRRAVSLLPGRDSLGPGFGRRRGSRTSRALTTRGTDHRPVRRPPAASSPYSRRCSQRGPRSARYSGAVTQRRLSALSRPAASSAVVQPTTRSRVDLGLRLERGRPTGRLPRREGRSALAHCADSANPARRGRCARSSDWLRRAYQENAAPPPPRRPAGRQAPQLGSLTVVIEASGMPGRSWPPGVAGEHGNLHIALCIKNEDAARAGRPGQALAGSSTLCPVIRRRRAGRRRSLYGAMRTVWISAGRTYAVTAPTATSFSPGATCATTGRCC